MTRSHYSGSWLHNKPTCDAIKQLPYRHILPIGYNTRINTFVGVNDYDDKVLNCMT